MIRLAIQLVIFEHEGLTRVGLSQLGITGDWASRNVRYALHRKLLEYCSSLYATAGVPDGATVLQYEHFHHDILTHESPLKTFMALESSSEFARIRNTLYRYQPDRKPDMFRSLLASLESNVASSVEVYHLWETPYAPALVFNNARELAETIFSKLQEDTHCALTLLSFEEDDSSVHPDKTVLMPYARLIQQDSRGNIVVSDSTHGCYGDCDYYPTIIVEPQFYPVWDKTPLEEFLAKFAWTEGER